MQNLVLHEGRPENTEGREEKEIRVYDLLDSLGIHYWRTDHEHADTMEACQDIDAVLDCLICISSFYVYSSKRGIHSFVYAAQLLYPIVTS